MWLVGRDVFTDTKPTTRSYKYWTVKNYIIDHHKCISHPLDVYYVENLQGKKLIYIHTHKLYLGSVVKFTMTFDMDFHSVLYLLVGTESASIRENPNVRR